jgi:hypothetical protein
MQIIKTDLRRCLQTEEVKKAYKKQAIKHHPDKGACNLPYSFVANLLILVQANSYATRTYEFPVKNLARFDMA